MNRILKIVLFLIITLVLNCLVFAFASSEKRVAHGNQKGTCIDSVKNNACDSFNTVWPHVYHPSRFSFFDSCISVTGIIKSIRQERDGDLHIQLELDSEFVSMLNYKNLKHQNGYLVCEIICVTSVSQSDAIVPCLHYVNNISIPRPGDYVSITGPHVLDLEHGWVEIHPVLMLYFIR